MKDIKSIHAIAGADRLVAEFEVRMSRFLPFCRLKIRIYHTPGEKKFCGYTNIEMIRKYDGYPEGACGMGHTVEETLKDTISGFLKMIEEDYPLQTYPKGVPKEYIGYGEI